MTHILSALDHFRICEESIARDNHNGHADHHKESNAEENHNGHADHCKVDNTQSLP